jgi:hypothetical protein
LIVGTDRTETPSTTPIDVTVDLSNPGVPVTLAGYPYAGWCCFAPLAGRIAEVVAASAPSVTDAEVQALQRYLSAKYGLP